MTLNTFVAGNSMSARAQAHALRQLGLGIHDNATEWLRARSGSEADWEGKAGEAFRAVAARNGGDADILAVLHSDLAKAIVAFSDDLDTVNRRMEQARQTARDNDLIVLDVSIYPPTPLPDPISGPMSGIVETPAQKQAATDRLAEKQTAYAETEAVVEDARQVERTAHEKLRAAADVAITRLDQIGQRNAWSHAAAAATNPASIALAGAAAAMEDHTANATRAMFERALAAGPHQTRGMWFSLSSAQQADLISRFPQLVGNADGLPVTLRHEVNMSLLAGERQKILSRIDVIAHNKRGNPRGYQSEETRSLSEALDALEKIEEYAKLGDKYLLSIDGIACDRGQVIIASGDPDKAQHVSTMVPGTFSDMNDAMSYVQDGDKVQARAQQLAPNEKFANITYVGYESPDSLPLASAESYAENGSADLARFHEGLRASHDGPPSHNTVIGHSYGTTAIGYAVRDHGVPVNDMVFMGSPGVGTWHSSQLGIPQDHVWAGTASLDLINIVPDGWYGANPADPTFGARDVPVDAFGTHGTYWEQLESVDGMARIISGKTEGMQ